jgi:hypothetical protein
MSDVQATLMVVLSAYSEVVGHSTSDEHFTLK